MEIATIGFTKSSAKSFFDRIEGSGVPALIDVRLNNSSQLAGFAKRNDLAYLLDRLCGVTYQHEPLLAPEEHMLKAYRTKAMPWEEYATQYVALLESRKVETELQRDQFAAGVVLLCSEAEPTHCHRRLAAEYLADRWGDVSIHHL